VNKLSIAAAAAVVFASLSGGAAMAESVPAEGGFDAAAFKAYLETRAGAGAPIFWYYEGTVRRWPTGELLARIDGVEMGRAVAAKASAETPWPEGAVHHISRKIFLYRDPQTNEVLRQVGGVALPPIKFAYQLFTYWRDEDRLIKYVEQGVGERAQVIGPVGYHRAQRWGDSWVFTLPVYFARDNSRPADVYETYDFFTHDAGRVAVRHQLSWTRIGPAPEALGGGRAVLEMTARRYDRLSDLPSETLKTFIETEAPLWREPPADLAAIRALQSLPREQDVPGFEVRP
jgi:hypothetical protein